MWLQKAWVFCRIERVEWLVGGLTTGGLEACPGPGRQSQVNIRVSTRTKWNFVGSLFRRYYDCSEGFTVIVNIKPDLMGSGDTAEYLAHDICISLYNSKLTFELRSRWSLGPWNTSGSPWARSCRGRWSCARQSSRPWTKVLRLPMKNMRAYLTPHLMSTTWYSRPCFSRQYSLILG